MNGTAGSGMGLCTQDSREGANAIAPNIHKKYQDDMN